MMKTTGLVPPPKVGPIRFVKIFFGEFRPGDVVSAIVGREVDAVRLVVGRYDDAANVGHVMFAKVFLIYVQHVRRRGSVDLQVFVKRVSVDVAEIASLTDPQYHAFGEPVKTPEQLCWANFLEIPRPNGMFDRFEHRVLADT